MRTPKCGSRCGLLQAFLGLAWLGLVAGLLGGCTELNPHFDPDGGPLCVAGERRCDPGGTVIEMCTTDATAFEAVRSCFAGSHCGDGLCLPDSPTVPCERVADCTGTGEACTVLVDPVAPARLGTYCLPAPYASGRLGGQACAEHEQCFSGWCYRSVCFEACVEAADCTNTQHQCRVFDVTVDGVRDSRSISGCAP